MVRKRNISSIDFSDIVNSVDTKNDKKSNIKKNDNKKSKLKTLKDKEPEKVFKGFYIEEDLLKVLQKQANKLGHGGQSLIINLALRELFEEDNLL